jgi:hypothetical protein
MKKQMYLFLPITAIFGSACGQDMIIISKDEECVANVWYQDADGDGFGRDEPVASCDPIEGYVSQSGDCDDDNPTIAPNAIEVCNNIDDDCDSIVDNDLNDSQPWYQDGDGDGYGSEEEVIYSCDNEEGYAAEAGDCDDSTAEINPNAIEVCDELDNNCDDIIDNDLGNTYYIDNDGDGYGYGDSSDTIIACEEPAGYSENDLDCDDSNSDFTTSCTPIVVTEQVCNGTPYSSTGTSTTEPELHILSAYEATNTGEIQVHVDRATQMTLVLSSYEPVHWIVSFGSNTQIDQVLLNGYHSQSITIDPSIPVETRSYDQTLTNFGNWCGYSLPYNGGGCDTNLLINGVTAHTGLGWTSFNGCYTAEQFLLE